MKYIVKCARFENPARVDSQFLGTFDLPNVEDDYLITDIVEAMSGIGDCVYYYEEVVETRNSSSNKESTETGAQQTHEAIELIKEVAAIMPDRFAVPDGTYGKWSDGIPIELCKRIIKAAQKNKEI